MDNVSDIPRNADENFDSQRPEKGDRSWLQNMPENLGDVPMVPNPLREGKNWIRLDDGHLCHPLSKQTMDLISKLIADMRSTGLDCVVDEDDGDDEADSPVETHPLLEMMFGLEIATGKIAGALDTLAYDDDLDAPWTRSAQSVLSSWKWTFLHQRCFVSQPSVARTTGFPGLYEE